MPRTILLRTHYTDPALETQIGALSAAGDVLAVVDESAGSVALQGAAKISLTESSAQAMGLYVGAPRTFWRCGDYALYAARQRLPTQDYFWMIEPDVRLSCHDIGQFFDFFDENCSADFLAAGVHPAAAGWDWAATMAARYAVVWQCLFPLVRISGKAIDFLFEQRRNDSCIMSEKDPATWPNDESFSATTLANNGYTLADFNDFGTYHTEATFSFWSPIQESALRSKPVDGLIYHPVLTGERYFEKLFYIAYCQRDFRELEKTVVRLTGVEWNEAEAKAYLHIIGQAKQALNT